MTQSKRYIMTKKIKKMYLHIGEIPIEEDEIIATILDAYKSDNDVGKFVIKLLSHTSQMNKNIVAKIQKVLIYAAECCGNRYE